MVGTDPSTDLALLDVDESKVEGGVKPLELGESDGLRPGEPTIAIGSPFGLQGTVTTGIVSALDREIQAPNGFAISGVDPDRRRDQPRQLRRPAARRRGPRDRRQLRRSPPAAAAPTPASASRSRSTPSRRSSRSSRRDGEIERAFIGVTSTEAAPRDGALVAGRRPASPPPQAGLRPGDLIVSLGDRTIASPSDLGEAVLAHEPGDTVDVDVRRDGDRETLEVTLGTRPDQPTQG